MPDELVQLYNPRGYYVLVNRPKGTIDRHERKPFPNVPFAKKKVTTNA